MRLFVNNSRGLISVYQAGTLEYLSSGSGIWRRFFIAAILVVLVIFFMVPVAGTTENYAKVTRKGRTFCHQEGTGGKGHRRFTGGIPKRERVPGVSRMLVLALSGLVTMSLQHRPIHREWQKRENGIE